MKLYFIHCGFYDEEISEGIYEFHVNIPVIAESIDVAKIKIRQNPIFALKKMHIDGIQEIEQVDGYQIHFLPTAQSLAETKVIGHLHRDL